MNNKTNNSTSKVGPRWDRDHSTYFWNIYLDRDHPDNNPEVEKLTGYSKQRFQDEAQDKDYLLQRKISMLYNNNYFKRMLRIEFFQKVDPIVDKMQSPKILTLLPRHYSISEFNHDVTFFKHGPWLKAFYECVNSGRSIESIIPKVRKNVDKDQFLDVTRYDFRIPEQLYAHGSRLLRFGHALGEVENFIRKYKELKKGTPGWE